MKLGKVLIYFAILVVLAGYVYFVEIRHKKEQEAKKAEAERIAKIEKDKIVEVDFRVKDGPRIVVRKMDDTWVLTEPVKVKADKKVVQSVLNAFADAQFEKVIKDKDVSWQEYGLEKPDLTITALTPDDSVTLFFGEQNPAKTSYYLREKGGQRLLLVADTLRNALNKSVFELREKTVFTIAPSDVDRIVVVRDGKETELTRQGPESWTMVKPESFKVKAAEISRNLIGLTNIEAKDIIDEPKEEGDPYGLAKPASKISLASKERQQTLLIGKETESKGPGTTKPDRYARIDGQSMVYVIGTHQLDNFKTDPQELRDRSILGFRPDDIAKMEVRLDGKTWLVHKSGTDKWAMEQPEKKASVEAWPITGMLWDLKNLEWKEMNEHIPGDLGSVGLDKPQFVATLYKAGEKQPITLKVGWPEKSPNEPGQEQAKPTAPDTSIKDSKSEESKEKPSTESDPEEERAGEEAKIPALVNAVVEPHGERSALYKVESSFLGRARKDLQRLGGEEKNYSGAH